MSWGPRYLRPTIPLLTLGVVVWASAANPYPIRVRHMAFGILTAASWLVSLNGVLFDFLSFYINFYNVVWRQSLGWVEQFRFDGSPLFAAWAFTLNPENYDLFWLHQLVAGDKRAIIAVFILLIIFMVSSLWLVSLLRASPADVSRSTISKEINLATSIVATDG
jgi:hypothetical protein